MGTVLPVVSRQRTHPASFVGTHAMCVTLLIPVELTTLVASYPIGPTTVEDLPNSYYIIEWQNGIRDWKCRLCRLPAT
jgi:hypothetical protein